MNRCIIHFGGINPCHFRLTRSEALASPISGASYRHRYGSISSSAETRRDRRDTKANHSETSTQRSFNSDSDVSFVSFMSENEGVLMFSLVA